MRMLASISRLVRLAPLAITPLLASACVGSGDRPASEPTRTPLAAASSSSRVEPAPAVPEIIHAGAMLRGISLAGADFGEGQLPGSHGKDYVYPDAKYANGYASPAYFRHKGMTVFRLPFRWERLQPERNKPFAAAELERLQTTVSDLRALGATVILDPHNYARYQNELIGSAAVPIADFADFWGRLATLYKADQDVSFGLMNEPHDMPSEQWRDAANAAIVAIRKTGAKNLILVPGNGWSGAHSWTQNWYGTPNAELMLTIDDPANNFAFEVHQYLDEDSSGRADVCVSEQIGVERMAAFTDWAKQHKKRAFLGEFNAGANPRCEAATQRLLNFVESNPDVFLGWAWWAGGPWWGSSLRILEPKAGQDAPQMRWLEPRLR